MKTGDVVRVYFDPLTEREFEGEARLRAFLSRGIRSRDGRVVEWWKVRFKADKVNVVRQILVPKEASVDA